ncbi:MAG: hypothetical protein O3B09_00975, partial [Proteobacteria bacterium]|nr:hypothetical protein [Pseudomonadota bacterium]
KAVLVRCNHCSNTSLHLAKDSLEIDYSSEFHFAYSQDPEEIDEHMIMHIPTSFCVIDQNIPKKLRNLIEEAEKCVKSNCLTGASACIRKAIYQFISDENLEGKRFEEKIKSLKSKHPNLDDSYIHILSAMRGITSDQVHEDSYQDFDNQHAKTYIELLKEIFREVYVVPKERKDKNSKIQQMFNSAKSSKDKNKKNDQKN